MITQEQARRICLSMPEIEQGWFRRPDFRIRGKVFAASYPGTELFDLKVGYEEQCLLSAYRLKYFIPASGASAGWLTVRIARVNLREFEELVWKAWRFTAPPRLVIRHS